MKRLLTLIFFVFIIIQIISAQAEYSYDNLSRLIKTEYANGAIEEFAYDGVGNRTGHTVNLSALSVELIDFTVYPDPDGKMEVIATWRTATETNTDYFSVQHSVDGRDFQQIGRVGAAGNSASILDYSFRHPNPQLGTNYYRLITHDLDGSQEISKVVSVNFKEKFTTILFPNPVNSTATLQTNGEVNIENIRVTDMAGRLHQIEISPVGEKAWKLDIVSLASGVYQVVFLANGQQESINMVVK